MPPIWKPDPLTMSHYYDTIMGESTERLNDWEVNFMESIEWKVRNGVPLTEAQEKKLEQIYTEKTK